MEQCYEDDGKKRDVRSHPSSCLHCKKKTYGRNLAVMSGGKAAMREGDFCFFKVCGFGEDQDVRLFQMSDVMTFNAVPWLKYNLQVLQGSTAYSGVLNP